MRWQNLLKGRDPEASAHNWLQITMFRGHIAVLARQGWHVRPGDGKNVSELADGNNQLMDSLVTCNR